MACVPASPRTASPLADGCRGGNNSVDEDDTDVNVDADADGEGDGDEAETETEEAATPTPPPPPLPTTKARKGEAAVDERAVLCRMEERTHVDSSGLSAKQPVGEANEPGGKPQRDSAEAITADQLSSPSHTARLSPFDPVDGYVLNPGPARPKGIPGAKWSGVLACSSGRRHNDTHDCVCVQRVGEFVLLPGGRQTGRVGFSDSSVCLSLLPEGFGNCRRLIGFWLRRRLVAETLFEWIIARRDSNLPRQAWELGWIVAGASDNRKRALGLCPVGRTRDTGRAGWGEVEGSGVEWSEVEWGRGRWGGSRRGRREEPRIGRSAAAANQTAPHLLGPLAPSLALTLSISLSLILALPPAGLMSLCLSVSQCLSVDWHDWAERRLANPTLLSHFASHLCSNQSRFCQTCRRHHNLVILSILLCLSVSPSYQSERQTCRRRLSTEHTWTDEAERRGRIGERRVGREAGGAASR
ncbi:unnamed protein product [Protopolystoma xenopodis]|uniref:Uncharacterized protein n=1 Tax=Protopolystoma xenopodis TaxID=117903 RepID=A0A448X0U8_9PLAT|nr:unnamed protein product [Protopolystoma xenopodis]